MNLMYFGTIEEVYAPDHKMNQSKLQYEYRVLVTLPDYSQIPVRCIRLDSQGSYVGYEDVILTKGYRTFVQFPMGDKSFGVIMGGSRLYKQRTDPKMGLIYEKRFNEVVQTIDFAGAYTLRSDDGPFLKIEKNKITLSDTPIKQDNNIPESLKQVNDAAQSQTKDPFDGTFIVMDKAKKELHINTNELKVVVNSNADVHIRKDSKVVIDGAALINVGKDATIDVKGGVTATVGKDLQADVKGETKVKSGKDVTVTSSGKTYVNAKEIQLNGAMGEVLTTATEIVTDFITGIPTQGVKNVKAGGG